MNAVAQAVRREALFGDAYCWYVLVCVLDLMMTYIVIFCLGGIEVNGVAHHALQVGGYWGLIVLKVATMLVVIAACEAIGRRRPALGKKVSEWAVAISAVPVVLALVQIAAHG